MLPTINTMARDLVAKVAKNGRCEFVHDVSEAMPVTVFMSIMGIPLELMAPLRERILVVLVEGDPIRREEIFNEIEDMLNPVIKSKMENPQDDVISRMMEADIFGRKPNFKEMQDYVVFLATAGLDTVTNAMSFTIRHLATDLELQERVRADPKLIVDMTEEMLRRYAVSSISRTVTRDVEFRGVSMKKGDRVHLLLPAANLDENVYEDPGEIVLGRTEPPVTFGTGVHRCLGSHLARLELRTVIEEVLKQWPTFTLDPNDPTTESAGLVYSVDRLPLVWTPKE
jgi:cytochrome P450